MRKTTYRNEGLTSIHFTDYDQGSAATSFPPHLCAGCWVMQHFLSRRHQALRKWGKRTCGKLLTENIAPCHLFCDSECVMCPRQPPEFEHSVPRWWWCFGRLWDFQKVGFSARSEEWRDCLPLRFTAQLCFLPNSCIKTFAIFIY